MEKIMRVLLGAWLIFMLISGLALACGAIDGKGYRCAPIATDVSSNQATELFFYFKDKEVHRAYLAKTGQVLELHTENLGAYSFTPGGMSWADNYELDKEALVLSVSPNPSTAFSCTLMASPLVEILAHFEPILEAGKLSVDASE